MSRSDIPHGTEVLRLGRLLPYATNGPARPPFLDAVRAIIASVPLGVDRGGGELRRRFVDTARVGVTSISVWTGGSLDVGVGLARPHRQERTPAQMRTPRTREFRKRSVATRLPNRDRDQLSILRTGG